MLLGIYFFEFVKNVPFSQAITISSNCNMVFRTNFLKLNTLGFTPRARYRMGDRQSVQVLQWLANIGRTRNNNTHAGNGREVHLPGVTYVKVNR